MVARLRRNRPLPDVPSATVDDSKTQRAFDAVINALGAVVTLLQPLAQPERWSALPFYGDWLADLATLQVPEFKKDPLGRVWLRGWTATAGGAQAVVGVLPLGYRPSARCSFPSFRLAAGVYSVARIDVDTDGRVLLVTPAVGAGTELTLDGISFDTEA